MAFIGFYEDGLDNGKAAVTEMRRIGREDYSRQLQIWTSCRVVCRPTEKEAREYAHYYVHEKGDVGAVETISPSRVEGTRTCRRDDTSASSGG